MASSQYFDPSPTVTSRRTSVTLTLADGSFTLLTDRGVFSADAIDVGTRLLLQEVPPPDPVGPALDLGCGYGPIALTLARRAPSCAVWAVDVNERARALCAENAAANQLGNVHVSEPASVPAELRFATIWSNPPIRIGKHALHELLATWLGRLAPTGRAVLVVQKHLGADSLATWLTEQGWSVERLTSRLGYRLLEVTWEVAS
jgi:16S rRNA (guanine1207-N2)-methyltransferase